MGDFFTSKSNKLTFSLKEKISCSPDWPQIPSVAENGSEPLILLLLPPKLGLHLPPCPICVAFVIIIIIITVAMGAWVPSCERRGLRTTSWSWFSPNILWVLGTELKLSV